MGEVWRARDRRLERSVAIKILPEEFSTNEHLKRRFEREAKTISQLNHPNICTVYDVGHDSGVDYLVMELIEGESLADRIARGPMPLGDVIRCGIEIADALEKAHRNGIVHRDLKPGNVMLTKSGAKLLDFGLARSGLAAKSHESTAATQQRPLTEEGVVVGTFRYMSPEQLGGDTVDHRSDIFALGAVVYEMVTGRRAFDGKSRTSIVTAIVSAEPAPMSAIRPVTPAALDRVVRACLAKDPDARFQSAHDVAMELRWLAESEMDVAGGAQSRWMPWSIAALLAITTAGVIAWHLRTPKTVASAVRFTIPPAPLTAMRGVPAVSPDGRSIIFRSDSLELSSMLWIRSLDSLSAKPLPGTEGASSVFWSPDGKHIGFTANRQLWRMDLVDGTTHSLYRGTETIPGGATWNSRDVILFSPHAEGQLHTIAASGGEAVKVSGGDDVEVWPWFLPDGDHFLYYALKKGISLGSLSTGVRKLLIPTKDIAPVRSEYASGYIFYNNLNALFAQRFDLDKAALVGDPQLVADEIEYEAPGRAAFAVSAGGTLVFHPPGAAIVSQLMFVDRSGRELANVGPISDYSDFLMSPDGRRVAFMRWQPEAAAWILDAARGASTRVSFERWAGFPVWMPNSRDVVYSAAVDRPPNLYLRHEDGTIEPLTQSVLQHYPTSITPDGKMVITELLDPVNDFDLIGIPVAPPHTPVPLMRTKFRESDGQVSPDGKWLAFASDDSRRAQIYAMAMPSGPRVQLSTGPGRSPRWSRDGRHLYYIDHIQQKVMDVDVTVEGGELRPAAAIPLFAYKGLDYDVTRDGRFLVQKKMLNPDSPPMTVVMNWTAALK